METTQNRKHYNAGIQLLFILLVGVLLAALAGTAILFAYESKHASTIYPGQKTRRSSEERWKGKGKRATCLATARW